MAPLHPMFYNMPIKPTTKLCSGPALEVHMFNVWIINMQSLNIKEWKLFELQITQTRHPLIILQKKMSNFKTPKMKKNPWNVYKIEGAHLQCMNNHYVKFEYKGMKTAGVTDYTNQTPLRISDGKTSNMSNFNTRKQWENIYQMCTKKRCTSSMCEQPICKIWL